jgi:nucleoid-associated protein YgaU
MSQHYVGRHATTAPAAAPRQRTTGSAPVRWARGRLGRSVLVASVAGAGAVGSLGLMAGTATAATTSDWERLASCESGGNWSIDTGNGYYGGVQFSSSTWLGYGGGAYASTANLASESEQIAIANRVLAAQGWGAWPVCSVKEGLSGLPTSGGATSAPVSRPVHAAIHHARTHHAAPTGHVTLSKHMYRVRSGDTLSTIALKKHVPGGWRTLWAANAKTLKNPDLIRVGQLLHLPVAHAAG